MIDTNDHDKTMEQALAQVAALDQERRANSAAREAALKQDGENFQAETTRLGAGPEGRQSDILYRNVGCQRMNVFRRTLTQVDGSLMASMFSGRWDESLARDRDGNIFIGWVSQTHCSGSDRSTNDITRVGMNDKSIEETSVADLFAAFHWREKPIRSTSRRRHDVVRLPTAILLILLLLFTSPVSSNTSSSPSSNSLVSWYESNPGLERAAYVRGVLLQRMEHVSSGRRMRDISRWIATHPQGAAIFSFHGGDPISDNNISDNKNPVMDLEILDELHHSEQDLQTAEVISARDPFSPNRMHLGLVSPPDAPPPAYGDGPPPHTVDDVDHANSRPHVLRLVGRAFQLGWHFAPVCATSGLALISRPFRQDVWYKWLATCMGHAGAAWIKWGQWSATRTDMFPDTLCRALSTLHADAPAHDFRFSQAMMESSLGLAPDTLHHVFDSIDPEPLASGSIAQVHKASLEGKLLAVKVRHPRVAHLMDLDFRLMSVAARLVDLVPGMRWLRIRESVDQFSATLAAQAHLHVEAYHLEVLNYNFRHVRSTRFPEPFFASSAVIIETFEPGVVFSKVLETFQREADRRNKATVQPKVEEPDKVDVEDSTKEDNELVQIADICPFPISKFILTTGLNLYLKMLLVDNLMHADLHPGNIIYNMDHEKGLATAESNKRALALIKNMNVKRRGSMSITLVDAGMVAQLNDHESSTFIGLLSSIGSGNGRDAAYFALQFSLENKKMTPEEEEEFTNDMVELFKKRCRGYGTNVDVGDVLRGVLGLVRKHQLRVDANFATLVVNVLCLESMGRACLPEYNVLDAARPLLETYRRLCYEPDGTPKPAMRRSKWAKFWLSLGYVQKVLLDNKLFEMARKLRQQRRIHHRALPP